MEIFAGSWLTKVLTKFFASKPYSQATREIVAKLFIQSWKNFKIGPFNSQLSLHMKWVMKTPRKHGFHTKITWKSLKNMGDTNRFQKQTKRTKIFLIWSTYVEHTHITFEHVQSHKWNRYSLNIRLVCCVCVSNVE